MYNIIKYDMYSYIFKSIISLLSRDPALDCTGDGEQKGSAQSAENLPLQEQEQCVL